MNVRGFKDEFESLTLLLIRPIYNTLLSAAPVGLTPFEFIEMTVTVSTDVNDPMKIAKITSPIRNQVIANILAGMDWGQRSPYLCKNE